MNQFQAFCERYRQCFTYKQGKPRKVGIEKEILVTDSDGYMADLHDKVWPYFKTLGLKESRDIYYKDETVGFYVGKDQITTDAGQGTFEVILEPYLTVQEVERHLKTVLRVLYEACEKENYSVLGMAFQPRSRAGKRHWNRKQRYEILLDVFKKKIYQNALSASDQAHIDVTPEEIIPVTNMMNGLAGFMLFLFANSAVRFGRINKFKNYRELLWDVMGKSRTGIPVAPFTSLEDYLTRMWNLKCVVARKGDRYFSPGKKFKDFVKGKSPEDTFKAFETHEGTLWFCARPRIYGTVEVRPTCIQPWDDMVTVAAFTLGIVQNKNESEAFLKDFKWPELRMLRYQAGHKNWGHKINGDTVANHIGKILQFSKKGLVMRGEGEETYLETLFARWKAKESPADKASKYFRQGGISLVIKHASLREKHLKGTE